MPALSQSAEIASVHAPRERAVFQVPFNLALLTITLLALIPNLSIGLHQFINYDGNWNIFTAIQDKWPLFRSEWKRDAHPILYYLLLRACTKLGHSHLIYRIPSLFPGVASIFVLGKIAEKLYDSRSVALLCAAAYGFSLTMLEIFCDVRSYPLALLFLLIATYLFVQFVTGLTGPNFLRSKREAWFCFGCSAFATLALFTEYYAAFLLVAYPIAVALLCLFSSRIHDSFWIFARTRFVALAAAIIVPCWGVWWLYRKHLRLQPTIQNNVVDFVWKPGSSVAGFLLGGLKADFNFISPIETQSTALFVAIVLIAAAVIIVNFRSRPRAAGLLAPVILAVLTGELMVFSVARRYPFGGFARQQSILFPFIILTGFLILDSLLRVLRFRGAKTVVLFVTAAAIASSFEYHWQKFPKTSEELFTRDYREFRSALPP